MNAQTDTALLEDDQESAATEPEQKSTTIKDDADEQNATKTALNVILLCQIPFRFDAERIKACFL